ncbi:MAG: Glu-tRNA(Gln) amidotransferase subunit GatD [Candidatus ainarchaeum sp.]|nr:Glu-tRNA(Gln) amidotransferase subunit GatD [Candidatus ainarchaeum sp.]
MELLEFLKKNKLNEGCEIEFEFKEELIRGTIIPTNTQNLTIKLDSGYNAGFEINKIKNIKKIKENNDIKQTNKIIIKTNPALPTISLLHTGGTIASRVDYKTGGVYASFKAEDMAAMFPELLKIANFNPTLVSNIMSEDMTLQDYSKIAQAVEKEIQNNSKGIIIGHGTDTLGYSAAFLSFALTNCPIPVIIVGSQRSSDRGSSDAAMNLICASEFIVKSDFKGVAICMHDSTNDDYCAILPATKTRKLHTSRRDAFKPVNDLPIAIVDYKKREVQLIKKENKFLENNTFKLKEKYDEKVGLLKIYPGISEKILEYYINEKYNGLIIEGTGLGHTPTGKNEIFIKKIEKLIQSGCVVAMTSQCINGRTNPNVYSTLRKLSKIGVIYCEDMLSETALIKLSWLLGNYKKEEAKKLLNQNIVGEISSFSRVDTFPQKN